MAETTQQYVSRLLAYTQSNDPLTMQREAPRLLQQLIAGVPEEKLRRRPSPDKWSIVEILAHLADAEMAVGWRYRQILEHRGGPLTAFDQDEWARRGDYASWQPQDAVDLFRLSRQANLRLLEKLTPEEFEYFGMHQERGRTTVKDLATLSAGHDRNHLDQIQRLLR